MTSAYAPRPRLSDDGPITAHPCVTDISRMPASRRRAERVSSFVQCMTVLLSDVICTAYHGVYCAPRLLAEMREGGVQRSAGDLNESRVGRVHLQDQEDRARNRQRGGEQAAHHGRIERGEEAETDEDDSEPENQHGQQGDGN